MTIYPRTNLVLCKRTKSRQQKICKNKQGTREVNEAGEKAIMGDRIEDRRMQLSNHCVLFWVSPRLALPMLPSTSTFYLFPNCHHYIRPSFTSYLHKCHCFRIYQNACNNKGGILAKQLTCTFIPQIIPIQMLAVTGS